MHSQSKKITLVFDSHIPSDAVADWEFLLATDDDWKDERDVLHALQFLGHRVDLLPVNSDPIATLSALEQNSPDVVFFMCESVGPDRELSANLLAAIELLNIPCTGSSAESLILCRDKGLSKSLLQQHHVPTPDFEIVHYGKKFSTKPKFPGPYIVKPLGLESSEGISLNSIVQTPAEVQQRINELAQHWNVDMIVEQFIEGRELYVAAMCDIKPHIFPLQELYFGKLPAHNKRIASYKAKWDKQYRAQWGIDSDSAAPIDDFILEQIKKCTTAAIKALKLDGGFVRFDLRMNSDNDFYFLEANPNPSIHKIEDFAEAAREYGWNYPKLIQHIISLALNPG